MPQLSYLEQQWVRVTRLLLGVAAPCRRGGMRRRGRLVTRKLNTLCHALSTHGLPRMLRNDEDNDSSPEDFEDPNGNNNSTAWWLSDSLKHREALEEKLCTADGDKERPLLRATLASYDLPHKTLNSEPRSWQVRRQRRIEAIDKLKKSWWYRTAWAKCPNNLQTPPEPNDRYTSKRQWERQIQEWKVSLKTLATCHKFELSAR